MSKSLSKSVLRFGLRALLVVPVFFVGETCTKLTEVPHNALTTSSAFHTPQEVLAGVAGVYAQMRATESNGEFASMEDLATDASVVPTRGSDWYDNGQWLDIHTQIWGANTAGALSFLTGSWNDMFSGVAKANLMISVLQSSTAANKDSVIAELRVLRAWYYYMLQDMFGGVPLVTNTELKQVARSTRPQVFSFLETELTESLPNLPDSWPASSYGRVTKGVANAILASLYINAGVFDKPCGPEDCKTSINPTGYNSCSGITVKGGIDACTAAKNAADAVINSGGGATYKLNPDWFANFSPTNKSSPENIFVVVHSASTQAIGGDWPMRTLHYNQLNTGDGSPWNGFATTAEYYAQFPAGDDRIGMWLVGQGKSFEPSTLGQPVNDRNGNPLIFTQTIPDLTKANEGNGIRFNKFNPIPDPPHGSAQPNDFTWFRLAEMYLIRAEAENELGNSAAALADINMIHTRHESNSVTATGQAGIRNLILTERALEFAGEGKRRTDLIRFGKFLNWTESSANGVCGKDPSKGCPVRDAHLIVFPISVNSMGSNPLLVQNAGY